MTKPRRRPNLTEKLAACLLMQQRWGEWLIPEPLRSVGTAKEICAFPEWHHDVHHAIKAHNDPRLLTPLAPAEHKARFPRDMAAIAKVRRGLKRRHRGAPTAPGDDPAADARCQARLAELLRSPPRVAKPKRVMPGSKASGWRKRMNGTVERR